MSKWDERFDDPGIASYKAELQEAAPENRMEIVHRAETDIHMTPERIYVLKEIVMRLSRDENG
jgi:hypothetical protein